MVTRTFRFLPALACCMVLTAGCRPPEPPELSASSVNAFGCQFPYGSNCFWGEGQLPGCSSNCRYANVPGVRIDFGIRILGSLVQPDDTGPLPGFPVYVLLPDNTKHLTRTDDTGHFHIEHKPDTSGRDTGIFEYDFGKLVTVQEAGAFAIVVAPNQNFLERHPTVEVREVEVADFDGETIVLE